jgi:hypothetical protein
MVNSIITHRNPSTVISEILEGTESEITIILWIEYSYGAFFNSSTSET